VTQVLELGVPRLVVHDPGGVAIALAIEPGARVGRDAECEVALADTKVSRHHATLVREGDGWFVADAGSRHGTFVNGERVERTRLADGDRIQIGSTILTFTDAESSSEIVARRTVEVGAAAMPADTAAATIERRRLAVFYGLAEAARSLTDRDALLSRALASVVETLGAERGLFALAPAPGASPRRVAEVNGADVVVGRGLVDATARGEAMLVRERLSPAAATLQAQGIRSAMAAPVHLAGRVAGFLYVDHRDDDRFGGDDLALLGALATLAGAIVDAGGRVEQAEARAEAAALTQPPPVIVGSSPEVLTLRRDVERLGAADLAVHITGETGVGKELVARAVHAASRRAAAPLVAVNCAALPDSLLDSELFGYVRGAFTGAAAARRGRFALADGGTLFLDEIADLSLAAQAKILRVLEDGELTPVGGERSFRVDVRVISASHKDLRVEVEAGRFREDLFYRLVVAEIHVPPLRDRKSDVPLLAETFLTVARAKGARVTELSPEARTALAAHSWPGNVRELRNVIERAAALATGTQISVEDLRLHAKPRTAGAAVVASAGAAVAQSAVAGNSLADQFASLDVTERRLVEDALSRANGNVAEAARLLGITRIMMKRRLDRIRGTDAE
jgi:Nif-specific regulatory protein